MTKRDTTLRYWPRRGSTIESMSKWREHIRQQITWIDEHRAGLKMYQAIRKTYLREFMKTSVELQRLRAANRKRECQVKKAA